MLTTPPGRTELKYRKMPRPFGSRWKDGLDICYHICCLPERFDGGFWLNLVDVLRSRHSLFIEKSLPVFVILLN